MNSRPARVKLLSVTKGLTGQIGSFRLGQKAGDRKLEARQKIGLEHVAFPEDGRSWTGIGPRVNRQRAIEAVEDPGPHRPQRERDVSPT